LVRAAPARSRHIRGRPWPICDWLARGGNQNKALGAVPAGALTDVHGTS